MHDTQAPKCQFCERTVAVQAVIDVSISGSMPTTTQRRTMCDRCYELQTRIAAAPDWLLASLIGWTRVLKLATDLADRKINDHRRLVDARVVDEGSNG